MSNLGLQAALQRLQEAHQARFDTQPLPQWLWRAQLAASTQRLDECREIIDLEIMPYRENYPEIFDPMFHILQYLNQTIPHAA